MVISRKKSAYQRLRDALTTKPEKLNLFMNVTFVIWATCGLLVLLSLVASGCASVRQRIALDEWAGPPVGADVDGDGLRNDLRLPPELIPASVFIDASLSASVRDAVASINASAKEIVADPLMRLSSSPLATIVVKALPADSNSDGTAIRQVYPDGTIAYCEVRLGAMPPEYVWQVAMHEILHCFGLGHGTGIMAPIQTEVLTSLDLYTDMAIHWVAEGYPSYNATIDDLIWEALQ
jgi:hypothetical protein